MRRSFTSTRRAFVGGALTLLPLWPRDKAWALAAARPADRSRAFSEALDALVLPVTPAQLDLVSYSETKSDVGISLRAVIRLAWPPGERQRLVVAEAADAQSGFEALLARAEAMFCTQSALDIPAGGTRLRSPVGPPLVRTDPGRK